MLPSLPVKSPFFQCKIIAVIDSFYVNFSSCTVPSYPAQGSSKVSPTSALQEGGLMACTLALAVISSPWYNTDANYVVEQQNLPLQGSKPCSCAVSELLET